MSIPGDVEMGVVTRVAWCDWLEGMCSAIALRLRQHRKKVQENMKNAFDKGTVSNLRKYKA